MLQWIGCMMLVVGGAGLGFYYSTVFRRRLVLLKSLHQAMNLLKGEISFGSLPLPDAFLRIAGRMGGPVADFLRALGNRMKSRPGEPFAQIFSREAERTLKGSGLSREDLEQLKDLGGHLGYLDRQTQLRTLDLYTHSLEDTIAGVKEGLPDKTRVSRSLGLMGGLFLAILLL